MSEIDLAVIATHVKPAQGFGGVAESVHNLCAEWARRGYSVRLCASDGSLGSSVTPESTGLPDVTLYRASLFRRWGFGWGAPLAVWQSCRAARRIYICGIATWPTSLAALFCLLLGRPFAIAPRGGTMPRLIALMKREKKAKWLYYRMLTLPSLRRAGFLHVTSALEEEGLRELLPAVSCQIVGNGLDLADWQAASSRKGDGVRIAYVGRLSREKGILRFAELWLRYRGANDRLTLLGSGAPDYRAKLDRLAYDSGGALEIADYAPRAQVADALRGCDFLALPSGMEDDDIRENFGNSVAEALAVGRPVLVTRGLAWDDIDKAGIGFTFDRDGSDFTALMDRLRQMSRAEHAAQCTAARAFAELHLDRAITAELLWLSLTRLEANPA
jgi:glycosyltransferase involved in cell wall biosynthesis